MENQIYAYIRVSGADQNEDRQVRAMKEKGVPGKNLYMDKLSGKDFDRPQYRKMIQKLREGDLLYVLSIDRLGRNYEEIQNQWRLITKEIGADICVIDMQALDTRIEKDLMGTFIADLVLQILSFVAQSERDNIRSRQAQGITAAKEKGIRFGRPKTEPLDGFAKIITDWEEHRITAQQAMEKSRMKPATFYRRVRELRVSEGNGR